MLKSYIFLEVRVLLLSGVKAFCPCTYQADGVPQSCPVCRGEAGAIPQLNPLAAQKAYTIARSLGCTLIPAPLYEKNTTTPELPPTYHLSQLSLKIGTDGFMDIVFHRRKKRIRITEIRIEEDAGRLTHSGGETRMDYSTAGMPSLRIRTEADFEIGEEAEVFLSDLRRRIQYLELISGVPVESVIRCNAHVALAPYPEYPRSFVKLRNLNSFNFVRKAINVELSRQEEIITNGGTVLPESRLWNETKNATESFQKRKQEAKARFVVLEGIPPYTPGPEVLQVLENLTVELPESRRNRFIEQYGLSLPLAEFICDEKSRADYFEAVTALGVEPRDLAQWMSSYIVKEFRRLGTTPFESALTPERLASIFKMLREKRIHGGIAKQTITAVLEEKKDPEIIIGERGWEQLTDKEIISTIVDKVIQDNPQEVRRVREGDARPIRFLTGRIMRESGGLAEPTLVKEILKEKLSVSLVYVLSMGGAISGKTSEDGTVESGDERILRELLSDKIRDSRIRFESIQVGRILSEEIIPSDWAALITTISERINSGTANGIVVAHGTDTLPYTAALLYWLFADAGVPIVLAASSTSPDRSPEAAQTMGKAIQLAMEKERGVYVVYGGTVLSPLNLKFERIGSDGFRNWNMRSPIFSGSSLLTGPLEADQYVITQLLEEAVNSMCIIKIYPGLRSDYLTVLMDQGVRTFFLELYDTGTAGFREGPYSLRRALTIGRKKQVRFYCTSQQEGLVDFSGYSTSRELWKEGAVPMGAYTTESVVARYLAASIIADTDEERAELMEQAGPELL
ncbi:MAG TPA: asparaginase domain-containing protein [Termitinemataceae bacterium]|nr:asparaginase domain-containing protein [Termitinemataceae bacterium]HPP99316.1 asparaginase domain-containing protein [Termitinemataceae bacterium]